MSKIDFVILWVDGNDQDWLKEKEKFDDIKQSDINNQNNRFRDWNLLRYWFRGVEQNADWVNKIYFVTWGHVPTWLNTDNKKIIIVKHEEFIPKEYLPTFNSNVIQYFLDRIPGISEKFVMFDDDQFIIKKVKQDDFFIGDYIRDNFCEKPIFTSKLGDVYPHSLLNNMSCINQYYIKKMVYKKNWYKFLSLKNGLKNNTRTLLLSPWSYFVGIDNPHICQCYTKNYYKKFWSLCEEQLKKASKNKFRKENDLTTFLIRYLILMDGNFIPRNYKFGKRFELSDDNRIIYNSLINKKYSVICINDSNPKIDFEKTSEELEEIFLKIFPNKSNFEK